MKIKLIERRKTGHKDSGPASFSASPVNVGKKNLRDIVTTLWGVLSPTW